MGSSADLTLASEEQVPRLSSALGDQVEAGKADRDGRLSLRSACYCSRQRGQLPGSQPKGLICMIAVRSSKRLWLGHQRKGRSWLSCSTTPFTR